MMERRPYFVVGDLLANAAIGAVVGVTVWFIAPGDWPGYAVMFLGMVLGMVLALPLSLPFVYLLGAMEVMLPAMMSGMVAGMFVGMVVGRASAAEPPSPATAAGLGALGGIGIVAYSYILNAWLTRKGQKWTF